MIALATLIVMAFGCQGRASSTQVAVDNEAATKRPDLQKEVDVTINPRLLRRFRTLPPTGFDPEHDPRIAELGKMLFFDRRLSKDRDLACSSCHDLQRGGADGEVFSIGHGKQRGSRNAPTVLNAAGAFAQHWDGRAATVEDQIAIPLLSPTEMGMAEPAALVVRLKGIPGYVNLFSGAFTGNPDPVSLANVTRAIGAYEKTLSTPGRWDRYLNGDTNALSHREKAGLKTFLNVGCVVCHTGPLLGGTMFERVGVVEPWPNQSDPGRMAITHLPSDRMMFKVPTLRNVARTAPYFHDGSSADLPDAVRRMGKHQLGIDLTSEEVEAITSWLQALDGELPPSLAAAPQLPE